MLGFVESSGYLVGTYVRDKDAVVTSMILAEMASELKKQSKTIIDRLNEIYDEFGLCDHYVFSYKFAGDVGHKKMYEILDGLRVNHKDSFGTIKVLKEKDYLEGLEGLPKSNILIYNLESDIEIIIRPSGTEPLIKVYVNLNEDKRSNAKNLKIIKAEIDAMMN